MIVQLDNFPSKGKKVPFSEIDIQPMTMKEILDFQYEYEIPNLSWNSKMYILITHFLARNQLAMEMPIMDLYVLLSFTSYLSTTQEFQKRYQFEFNCPRCSKKNIGQITLRDIEFNNVDPEFYRLESIILGEQKFFLKIPTIRDFYNILGNYRHIPIGENSARIMFVLSCLQNQSSIHQFYDAINNAKLDDIALINYLFVNLCFPLKPVNVKCKKCKGGAVSVDISEKLTDMFRLISLNNRPDKNKITFL